MTDNTNHHVIERTETPWDNEHPSIPTPDARALESTVAEIMRAARDDHVRLTEGIRLRDERIRELTEQLKTSEHFREFHHRQQARLETELLSIRAAADATLATIKPPTAGLENAR